MKSLIDKYTKEELKQIVDNSNSISEVIIKLGYSTKSGGNSKTVKDRLKKYNISIEHFSTNGRDKRTIENIFCENSTASQATMRRWYEKGNYTEYKCSICGQKPKWKGKDLTLILDHKNGKNNDHRIENLRWVCPNCNQQLETTGYKKMRTKKRLKKKYYCIDCGKEISKQSVRCKQCNYKYLKLNNKRPSKEDLQNLIYKYPFTQIGKMYGVTDNAVRKWCKSYDLPFKKKDINTC